MNLYIYQYNNYYNRTHKKAGDSIADYEDYLYYGPVTGVFGFTPGDGVNTTQIIGSNVQPYYDGAGDYLIAHDPKTNKIDSRWFIIDHDRTRDGQWHLTLHRDLMADFYDKIVDAPTYIEKATLNDEDPLIYNSEQLNVNQIKTNQTLIKDKTNSAWLVGYLAPNLENDIVIEASTKIDYNLTVDGIENWDYFKYSNLGNKEGIYANPTATLIKMKVAHNRIVQGTYIPTDELDTYSFPISNPARAIFTESSDTVKGVKELYYKGSTHGSTSLAQSIYSRVLGNKKAISTLIQQTIGDQLITDVEALTSLNGLVIKDTVADVYYDVIVVNRGATEEVIRPVVPGSNIDLTMITNVLGDRDNVNGGYFNGIFERNVGANTSSQPAFYTRAICQRIDIYLYKKVETVSKTTIKTSTALPTDAAYRMFCMPYNKEQDFAFKIGADSHTMKADASMSVMNKLIAQYSSTLLYDAQILPYCPVPEFINELGEFDLENVKAQNNESLEDIKYTIIKNAAGSVTGFIAYATKTSFNLDIDYNIPVTNFKIVNECDKYRLCSPNFNGAFDFNLAKNGGLVGFKVSCTYKPYQPYIKVAPIFGGLYGTNFQDPRGLVCGGEFGLPLLNDKWAEYEINNKNYLNSFNRQIENMEVQQKIGRTQEIVSAIAGTVTGIGAGAMAGSMTKMGAAGGGVLGGAASAMGGIADVVLSDKLRHEALDYTRDQFNYNLENIQALPYTLSRVSSLNIDNTIYPVLEFYTCTDREKEALANKIAWNGMTVMAIGKIKDYIGNTWSYGNIVSKGYIKGKLIRLDDINEDFHMVNAISGELNKGVYIQ